MLLNWHWRRLLRVPWTSRRSNLSILKEISPECSWKDWWSWNSNIWPPDTKSWLIWKDPDAGKGGERDNRGWDSWMTSPTQCTWVWVGSRSWWWAGRPGVLQLMGLQRVGHDWATDLNWTELSGSNDGTWAVYAGFISRKIATSHIHVHACSDMSDSLWPSELYVACVVPLSIEFPRQKYWSGLPFPSRGHLPDPGIKPARLASPALAGGFFTTVPLKSLFLFIFKF